MSINNQDLLNTTKSKLLSTDIPHHMEDQTFDLSWNDILYDGGLATWLTRSSFRWLTISVCLIGIIGNLLAVCTLLRRRMRTLSTYAYLTALCLSNSITLSSVIVFELEVLFAPSRFNCIFVASAKGLASSTFALSTWITLGFTIDRYIMICYPFTGEKMCTRRNAFFVLILCLFLASAYLIPQMLANSCHAMSNGNPFDKVNHSISYFNKSESNSLTFWVSGLSDLGKSLAYRLTITLFVNCFLVRIIPFLVVFKLNLHLIQTLAHTKRRHRQINPYEQKRNDVTHMLVIVISIYLICIMPSIPFAAFFAYNPDKYVTISYHYRTFQHLDEFGKFLMIFNSASQCYLYIFFGKRFRRELTHLLCCFCMKYFYISMPQNFTNHSDRETFLPDFGNNNDTFELVLSGKWSLDQRQDSIAGIEFSFHHPRRWSRLTSSSATTARSDSDFDDNRINFNILQRFKNRVEQLFTRFQQ
ncbi:unnamed protein product [Adineta steineri]|uniref:G-protein coupled receptors family 1 profile domain-containing protein n=1 Tax=Adineta steineri TaxID=433720 RepID=A0A819A7Q7_9BILA|nr:unnamed protein product [Adineta steineri]CAF3773606.1 unnamed protein product [Adineta steineri]